MATTLTTTTSNNPLAMGTVGAGAFPGSVGAGGGTTSIKHTSASLIKQYKALTKQLFEGIVQQVSGRAVNSIPLVDLMKRLIETDASLQKSIKELEEHQAFQRKISDLRRELENKDLVIARLASDLKQVESMLEQVVEDAKSKLQLIYQADRSKVSAHDLISYAKHISYTTSAAPPGWEEREQLVIFRPPHPSEEQMRSGLLYTRFPGLYPEQEEQQPPEIATGLPVLPPPTETPSVAVTPKKEEIFPEPPFPIPKMPAGWKPGDPIDVMDLAPGFTPEALMGMMNMMGIALPPEFTLPPGVAMPPPPRPPQEEQPSAQLPPRPVVQLTGLDFDDEEEEEEDDSDDDDDDDDDGEDAETNSLAAAMEEDNGGLGDSWE